MAIAKLELLPAEVLLAIFKLLPDLRSLHAIVTALPLAYRLFPRHGPGVFNAITSDPQKTPPQTRDIIRLVVITRCTVLPAWELSEFWRQFMTLSMLNMPPEDAYKPHAPDMIPFSILVTAKRVHDGTQKCLAQLLADLRGIIPRMERDRQRRATAATGSHDLSGLAGRKPSDKEERERIILAMAPASWVEEQVVIRAFWRYYLLLEVRHAARHHRLRTWAHDDERMLAAAGIREIISRSGFESLPQCQELLAIVDHLEDPDSHVSKLSHINVPRPIPRSEYWVRFSGTKFRQEYVPRSILHRHGTHNNPKSLIADEASPLCGAPGRLFRRYGLVLWDSTRIGALGLAQTLRDDLSPGEHEFMSDDKFWPAWISTLSHEEFTELKQDLETERRNKSHSAMKET